MLIYHTPAGEITATMLIRNLAQAPAGACIEVPDELIVSPCRHIVRDGQLVLRQEVTAGMREAAQDQVTQRRGEARRQFVTDLPGQDMVYLEKRAEAVAFLAHGEPTATLFPMVFAEVGITASTAHEVAQVWLNMSELWRQASAVIEAATLRASSAIEEAGTPADLDDALLQMETAILNLLAS